MTTVSYIVFLGFVAVIFSIFLENFFDLWKKIIYFQKPVTLAIGILSSRENFLLRETGRTTWLTDFSDNDSSLMKTWFILGNCSCSIPPEYRISLYGCEKWNINISGAEGTVRTLKETKFKNCFYKQNHPINYQGYSFKVNHPIIVTKLGVLSSIFLLNKDVKVAILDIQTKEVIIQITLFNNDSISYGGFMYSEIDRILFPKGYEGLVLFEGYMPHENWPNVDWNDGGGAITFTRIYPTSYNLDSIKFTRCACSIVSMEFYVNDLDNLKAISNDEQNITEKWQRSLEEIQEKIEIEKQKYNDILIVDVMDFYRNLPVKLLKFYNWIQMNQKCSYVLKTDDDSIINVKMLLSHLEELKLDSKSTWLWSRFRKDWPVNYIGKWVDYDYKSSYYPSFPCGAAYVMSYQTILWLSKNSDSLFSYQGEDVSHGIWLSAINADFVEDKFFECDSGCKRNSYNRGQLNIDQITEAWSFLKQCNSLCNCDKF